MFDSKRVQTGLAPKPCFMTHIIASAFEGTEGREGRRTWGVDGELASPPHISFPKARSNVQLGPWQAKGKPWSKILKLSILGAGGGGFSGGRGAYRTPEEESLSIFLDPEAPLPPLQWESLGVARWH